MKPRVTFAGYELDTKHVLLSYRGRDCGAGPKVVQTLIALVATPGEILSKDELIGAVWPDGYVDETNLMQNIYALRRQFRSTHGEDFIETVPRRGYRFVRPLDNERAPRSGMFPAVVATGLAVATMLTLLAFSINGRNASHAALYASARALWSERTPTALQHSLDVFSSLTSDPSMAAKAYSGVADAYSMMVEYGIGNAAENTSRARTAATHALALGNRCSECLASMALIQDDFDNNHTTALRYYRRALDADPRNATARTWYGASLLIHGSPQDAAQQLRIAHAANPDDAVTLKWLAYAEFFNGDHNAIRDARAGLALHPDDMDLRYIAGISYETAGQPLEAIRTLEQVENNARWHEQALGALAWAYAKLGSHAKARALFARLRQSSRHPSPAAIAVAAAAVNDRQLERRALIQTRSPQTYADALATFDPRLR
jgi:DNA-binding winged helix-turn-helix (wHTH) protein/Tfp pilus assembly protein PilF